MSFHVLESFDLQEKAVLNDVIPTTLYRGYSCRLRLFKVSCTLHPAPTGGESQNVSPEDFVETGPLSKSSVASMILTSGPKNEFKELFA